MPQNGIRKNAPWQRNSTSGFKVDAFTRSGTNVCVIMNNFSKISPKLAIQIIQNGRRPPFWIMEESVFEPFYTMETPLPTYTPNLVKIS